MCLRIESLLYKSFSILNYVVFFKLMENCPLKIIRFSKTHFNLFSISSLQKQLVNLGLHLQKARLDIERKIPDPNFNGLAVIDWEPWRPLWETNWNKKRIYKVRSVESVRQRFPSWPLERYIPFFIFICLFTYLRPLCKKTTATPIENYYLRTLFVRNSYFFCSLETTFFILRSLQ